LLNSKPIDVAPLDATDDTTQL